jgi:hypothetical protein
MKLVCRFLLMIAIMFSVIGCQKTDPQASKVSSQPPKIGESMRDVVTRLGPPLGDEAKVTDSNTTHVTSYTDSEGTVHHITVENGTITKVSHTGSQ